jgi:zinc protease
MRGTKGVFMSLTKYRLRIATVVLVLLVPGRFFAQNSADQDNTPLFADSSLSMEHELSLDPLITYDVLENGLTYYIRENSRPEKRAFLRLGIKVGSVLERDDQRGIANFIEHMAFNGTQHYPKPELIDFLQSVGMRFGPNVSAYTNFDQTVFELSIPVENPLVLELAFLLLRNWVNGIAFDEEEIEKERAILLEDWAHGSGADARMLDKQYPALFRDSRYAERLPIGTEEGIESYTRDDLLEFYADWYRPELMAVIAVGDFETELVQQLVIKYFSDLTNPDDAPERLQYPVPDHETTLVSIATDPEAEMTTANIYYKTDVVPEITLADYRLMIIQRLFSNMLNLRLQEKTQSLDAPFLYAASGYGAFIRSKAFYYISAVVPDDGIIPGLEALAIEAARVREHGFTASELERAKKQTELFIQSLYNSREESNSGPFADEYLRNFFEGEFVPGLAGEFELHNEILPGITVEEVNAVCRNWMALENRVVLINAPQKADAILPSEADILALLGETGEKTVESYVDVAVEQPLLDQLPTPGRIVSEKVFADTGIYEWRLSNGIRVVLKPTDFKTNDIEFTSFSPGGTSVVPDRDYIAAVTATAIVSESGIGNLSQSQLDKLMVGRDASVTPTISELTEGLYGSASPSFAETMFQLIYLYVTAPKENEETFLIYKKRLINLIQNRESQPDTAFSDELQRIMSNGFFRELPFDAGSIDELNLEKSLAIYRDRFSDLGDAVFVFVGNIDLDVFRPLVEMYLASLPTIGRIETWKDDGATYPTAAYEGELRMGIETKSTVSLVFPGEYTWSIENNYLLESLADMLSIRLRELLREELGASSAVNIWTSKSRYPRGKYTFSLSFSCNPEKAEELTNIVLQEIEWLTFFVDEEYVRIIKDSQIRKHGIDLKTNGYWLDNIRNAYFHEIPVTEMTDLETLQESFTAASLEQTAFEIFDFGRFVKLILYPASD